MKTSIFISLSALTLFLVATPTSANEISAINQTSTDSIVKITPFDLVYGAYRGYFTDSGIPGYANLIAAVNAGRVNAEDLVEEAIALGRLAPETINNRAYLNSVAGLLDSLDTN
ncbi:hypothetical protein [Myxosarcina sp. GI1]|uniref:hypothetical protein n=1 Tax=Myxosarcina sp. GI1 TaxID=1541065 RepID=UPI000569E324|nr:hypothetical protein [Myxosarcina sp. GI1]